MLSSERNSTQSRTQEPLNHSYNEYLQSSSNSTYNNEKLLEAARLCHSLNGDILNAINNPNQTDYDQMRNKCLKLIQLL